MKLSPHLKRLLPVLCLGAALVLLLVHFHVSPGEIVRGTSANPVLAALLLVLLYALKGATVVFPVLVLEVAAGLLYPTAEALLVNFLGIMVMVTVPYWIGRYVGVDTIQKLVRKSPKFAAILDRQHRSAFFLCFLLRSVGGLPVDVVSLYLGATKTAYPSYLVASTLGLLPGMVLATLLGTSIEDPTSPVFWLAVSLKLLSAGASFLFHRMYQRKHSGEFQ